MASNTEHVFVCLWTLCVSSLEKCLFRLFAHFLFELFDSWSGVKKLKMELPFDLAILLLGLYPKNPETPIQKNLCTPMFIAVQFTIAKCWKQPKCPSVNEWIKKLWYIYTMEFYIVNRKKELLPFATAWMDLESIMLNERNQEVKDKYHMISPISQHNQQNKQASKI